MARRDKRNCAAGAWLSVYPIRLNGTGLLVDKCRFNICLQYNHSLLDMLATCNGCEAKMTVEHALSCKPGGIVHIRHDDVADEWRHLCCTALSPSQVKCEPRIKHMLVVGQELQRATPFPLLHRLILQKNSINPRPLRNGALQVPTNFGNAEVRPYLICQSRTRMPNPTGRRILEKFWRWISFLVETPSHGLAKNSNLQYVYHFIFINFVKNSLSSLS